MPEGERVTAGLIHKPWSRAVLPAPSAPALQLRQEGSLTHPGQGRANAGVRPTSTVNERKIILIAASGRFRRNGIRPGTRSAILWSTNTKALQRIRYLSRARFLYLQPTSPMIYPLTPDYIVQSCCEATIEIPYLQIVLGKEYTTCRISLLLNLYIMLDCCPCHPGCA